MAKTVQKILEKVNQGILRKYFSHYYLENKGVMLNKLSGHSQMIK